MKIVNMNFELGECPIYDEVNNIFYCVDILQKKIYRFIDDSISSADSGDYCGCIFLDEQGVLYAVLYDGIYSVDFENNKLSHSFNFHMEEGFRSNDGKVNPKGELLVGSMNNLYNYREKEKEKDGKLYLVTPSAQKVVIPNVATPNGILWIDEKMLYIDTFDKKIIELDPDYNMKKVVREFGASCDGMCMDGVNNIYVAVYNQAKVVVFNYPTGDLLQEYTFPDADAITACAFGGANMNELYVTSASPSKKGKLYILPTENIGVPFNRFKKS